jgi:hypothetical protein
MRCARRCRAVNNVPPAGPRRTVRELSVSATLNSRSVNRPGTSGTLGTAAAAAHPRGKRFGIATRRAYAATGSSTMSRVRDGSTFTPGPIVVANVTERM